ncbi:MAG: glycosyltransferase family 4 protein [Acidobacteriota bacterium]
MNIAFVAPSPKPFARGGAERLWSSLAGWVGELTPHQVELIKLPVDERTQLDLMAGYEAFAGLDLSHFDAVVTGKYPAWMVRHRRHIVYMLHPLRGLYDYYPPSATTRCDPRGPCGDLSLLLRNRRRQRASLEEIFVRYRALAADGLDGYDAALVGPLTRELVHFFDGIALSPDHAWRHYAISRTVAERPGYFPVGGEPGLIYPPTSLEGLSTGGDDSFLPVSRLDVPKRVDLLIRAFRRVKADIPFLIAGSGGEERRLRALAADDERIRFLGAVGDRELRDLYRDALAVPFAPVAEDFGLVALEAMRSGKPVVTAEDSGGPCELVVPDETGLVTPATAEALASAMQRLVDDRTAARELGERAEKSVRHVSWPRAIERLLDGLEVGGARTPGRIALEAGVADGGGDGAGPADGVEVEDRGGARKKAPEVDGGLGPERRSGDSAAGRGARGEGRKIVVATTFPIYPPQHGGAIRVFELYRQLAGGGGVEVVCLDQPQAEPSRLTVADGLIETRVPRSEAHQAEENKIATRVGGIPIGDIAATELWPLTPAYRAALARAAEGASALVACHPYPLPVIQQVLVDQELWYEAQDVEIDLKERLLHGVAGARELLDGVETIEASCCELAARILVCTREDGQRLAQRYDFDPAALQVVPNGVNCAEVEYVGPRLRRRKIEKIRAHDATSPPRLWRHPDRLTTLFLGSWHGPNLDAVEALLRLAPTCPEMDFIIAGSVGLPFAGRVFPENVKVLGIVSDEVKRELLAVCDLALNPVVWGSGSNLKVLEYGAAGIPVLSTPFGLRGIDLEPGLDAFVAPVSAFGDALCDLRMRPDLRAKAARRARRSVESRYDWRRIAERLMS